MRAKQFPFTLLAAMGLLTLSLPVPAFSQMKEMPSNECRVMHGQMTGTGHMDSMDETMGMCMAHADKMGLSDDQMAKMRPLHIGMQKKQARYNADLKIAEIELMEIMDMKDFDLDKANFAVKKIAEIKTAHQLEMLKAMKEMRSILTDEQFRNMKKMMSMNMGEHKPTKKMMKK
jgi:Spy/CpxP family protein refolding chaperone